MKKTPKAKLTAAYFALRAEACNVVALYEEADAEVPQRLLRFAGLSRATKQNKGPRPVVLPTIIQWFIGRNNEPATYRAIAEANGLKVAQVRTCISRNEVEAFERAGDEKVADKLYAKVRLSACGLGESKGA